VDPIGASLDAIFERATMGKQGGTSKNHFFSSVIPNNAKLREPKKRYL
jgi:hypothetical protein